MNVSGGLWQAREGVTTSVTRTRRRMWVALFLFTFLFTLLFQYRILSLLKRLGVDVNPIGTKLPITLDFQGAPQWLLPLYHTLDYLNIVWFTTVLGLLIAGAMVAFLPDAVRRSLTGNGLRHHLAGSALGLPNMFCSCCAVGVATGLRRAGASLGASLAFFVAAPTLNIVVILLAFDLLPLKLAVVRLVLGLAATVGVTYVAAKLSPEVVEEVVPGSEARAEESIAEMARSWLSDTWDIARAVVPLLVVGLLVIGIFKVVLPFDTIAKGLGDGLPPTVLAAAVGTILMVPTFTEVLWVGEFTRQGMGVGPAVALLITLPAVSFPSLWVLGKVLKSCRTSVLLGILIFCLGIAGGALVSTN